MTGTPACTTLVVDDNDTKRYIIGSWLRRAGHVVVEAASAAETWRRLAEHEIELVVLDVRLPDMSGIEVCERIKSAPRTGSLPVIHISAHAVDIADRVHGLRRGADAYMTDPIDPGEFLATVEAVLRYYRALHRAERMASRLAAFTRTSLRINAAGSFEELAAVAVHGAHTIFGTPAAVFTQPLEGRPVRTVERGGGPEYRDHPSGLLPRLVGMTGLADDTGTEVRRVPAHAWRELLPDTVVEGDAVIAVSRLKADRPAAAIVIDARGVPEKGDTELLRQLGQTLALAMEALRSYTEEHTVSLTIQRSLLPAATPPVPGWAFAVRYAPAGDQAEVGGDFYEVLDRGDRVLVAIGDVQGHSLLAATVMAEIRHALRAFAAEGHDAVTILRLLNDVMERYHGDQTATMCLLTLDPRTGAAQVANAGHIPPLHISGGRARYGSGGGVLLGFPVEDVAVEETVVPPGGIVMLLTDGLIEDRGIPLGDNLERLRAVAGRAEDDLERFSDRVLAEFGHREDDVAMIVLRRDGARGAA
ncbi:Serine phosphatase RsbU, regulator of sigma subunit [Actinomadura madurae]|uniref:Serine phosphatase RsbU, regulator of sigma subunit n=1 Tax=Actinomadura madurae TaxID=1993 RepID=A0A1I5WEI0_9ACTN|nr:fused response regulator/phosphatase [Actinomadura madurae]SFQ18017.1 Serine phosphatase RsbU, regulator of sigma subunit [Actinomadura madurae]